MMADLHSGSTNALFPNHPIKFINGINHHPTSIQKKMYKHWIQCAEYTAKMRQGKKMIVLVVGDAREGLHHDRSNIVTHDTREQDKIHIELMEDFLKITRQKGDRVIYLIGTECHTDNSEYEVADTLGAEVYETAKISISGANIWAVHKFGGVGQGLNEGDSYRNKLKQLYFDCIRTKTTPPDAVISAHFHKDLCASFDFDYHLIRGRVLPSWQFKTRYALGVAPFDRNDIGMGFMNITEDGQIKMMRPLLMK